MLAAFVAVLGLAGLAMALVGSRAVSGEEGPINARTEAKVPVEVALAKPEPALPEGMPTSRPKIKRARAGPAQRRGGRVRPRPRAEGRR